MNHWNATPAVPFAVAGPGHYHFPYGTDGAFTPIAPLGPGPWPHGAPHWHATAAARARVEGNVAIGVTKGLIASRAPGALLVRPVAAALRAATTEAAFAAFLASWTQDEARALATVPHVAHALASCGVRSEYAARFEHWLAPRRPVRAAVSAAPLVATLVPRPGWYSPGEPSTFGGFWPIPAGAAPLPVHVPLPSVSGVPPYPDGTTAAIDPYFPYAAGSVIGWCPCP